KLNEDYVEGTLTCLKPSTIEGRASAEFPLVLNIEPTNLCNLRCVYCPRERAAKGRGFMDWDLFTRVVDEAAECGPLVMLNLHKDGEPFMHPRFLDMARYARDKDAAKTIHVNTNAMCWDDATIERMLDSGLDDITVSLDAARPETFKRLKGADALERVERSVRRAYELRERRNLKGPFIRVKIMEFGDVGTDEVREFHEKWRGVADQVQVTGAHSWSGAIEGLEVTDETSRVRYPCMIMWYAMVLNWDGTSTVCSVDWNTEILLGDANRQTLSGIWKSPQARAARRSQMEEGWGRYPVCESCVVWVSVGDMRGWIKSRPEFWEDK
ncbi:MAG TPA: radical SAM/SPASM domain-containing protein, partial [Geothrix sp.]|nr:radical SAM/SPASM domain-containing protein [Geothrix sp.]